MVLAEIFTRWKLDPDTTIGFVTGYLAHWAEGRGDVSVNVGAGYPATATTVRLTKFNCDLHRTSEVEFHIVMSDDLCALTVMTRYRMKMSKYNFGELRRYTLHHPEALQEAIDFAQAMLWYARNGILPSKPEWSTL